MSSLNGDSNDASAWNDEAKAAFTAFKKKKRNLPSPGEVDNPVNANKKPRRLDAVSRKYSNRTAFRNQLTDRNRDLNIAQNDPFVPTDNNIKSSTMSEKFMSMDVSEFDSDKTEVVCGDIEKNLAPLHEMIAKKEDPYIILEQIVQQLAESQKKYAERINKLTLDYARLSAHHNDQLVSLENRMMKEVVKIHQRSEDRLNAIEFTYKCSNENNILWLSFADSNEIGNLRIKTKAELINEAKNILTRMNIWCKTGDRTIVDVFTQKISIKTENGFDNEMIMGIKFLNSYAMRDVRRLAAQYAKNQFIAKNYDSIRYIVRDNWSSEIWKLLRVCYDLNRVNLIDKAAVCDAGIQVFFKKIFVTEEGIEETKNLKTLIRTESDLDELRVDVSDIALNVPSFQLYDGNYFKMNNDERNQFKNSLKITNIDKAPELQSASDVPHSSC